MTQPTAQQVAFAILDCLPNEISYSGSEQWSINDSSDLTPIDGDGGAPFAVEIFIEGKSFTIAVAASEDVNPEDDMRRERSISFEVDPTI